jgi:hypothetical protein
MIRPPKVQLRLQSLCIVLCAVVTSVFGEDTFEPIVETHLLDRPVEVLKFNGVSLKAKSYTTTTYRDSLKKKARLTIDGNNLLDEIEGEFKDGKLDGPVTIFVKIDENLKRMRPNLAPRRTIDGERKEPRGFAPTLEDFVEIPYPRLAYFKGVAASGRLVGNLILIQSDRIVADMRITNENAIFEECSVILYHPEAPHIPTRRFFGRVRENWDLAGSWEDIPWNTVYGEYIVNVIGNTGFAHERTTGFTITGSYGKSLLATQDRKLFLQDAFGSNNLDERYVIDKDYSGSVMGSFKIPDNSEGLFHGIVKTGFIGEQLYLTGRFSPARGLVENPVTVHVDGKEHPAEINDGVVTWITMIDRSFGDRFKAEYNRWWDSINKFCRSGEERMRKISGADNISSNFGVTFGGGGFRLMNNEGYVPSTSEAQRSQALTREEVTRIANDFKAASHNQIDGKSTLGLMYLMELKMNEALAEATQLNPEGSEFFRKQTSFSEQALDNLMKATSLNVDLAEDLVAFQTWRLAAIGRVNRSPATIGSFFSMFFTADAHLEPIRFQLNQSLTMSRLEGLDAANRLRLDRFDERLTTLANLVMLDTSKESFNVLFDFVIGVFNKGIPAPESKIDFNYSRAAQTFLGPKDYPIFESRFPEMESREDFYRYMTMFLREEINKHLNKNNKTGFDFTKDFMDPSEPF